MSRAAQNGAGMWSCYVKQDQATGLFIGHCLNLHVKVAGRNADEAWSNLGKVVKAHYEYCVSNDPDGLTVTAPMTEWAPFNAALEKALRENPNSIRIVHIEFNVGLPRVPGQVLRLSSQGVEIGQPAPVGAQGD